MQTAAYRESLRKRFDEQHKRIEDTFKGLSADQFSWAPDEKTWSIGHCLYHIWLTNDKYLVEVPAVIREGRHKAPEEQEYEPNGIGRRFIAKNGPVGGQNTPVPKVLRPDKRTVPPDILQLTVDQLAAFDEFLQESARVDMMRTKMRSPVLVFVKLQLGDVFMALAEHNERHIRQAERLTHMAGFPGGARTSAAPVS